MKRFAITHAALFTVQPHNRVIPDGTAVVGEMKLASLARKASRLDAAAQACGLSLYERCRALSHLKVEMV